MPANAAVLLLALLAGQNEEEESLTPELEEPDLTQAEQEAIELEAVVVRKIPYGAAPVDLPRGDTVFVDVEVPLRKAPAGPIEARVKDLKVQARIGIFPVLEAVEAVSAGRKVVAKGRYALRAAPNATAATSKLTGTIEVRDRETGAVVAKMPIAHTVAVGKPAGNLAGVDLDKRALALFEERARAAHEKLTSLKAVLKPDRATPPPEDKRPDPAEREALAAYLESALRADIARDHLRAACDHDDPAVQEAAVLAVASLEKKRTLGGRPRENLGPTDALFVGRNAVDDLDFGRAEAVVEEARKSGRLTVDQLAEALRLQGAVLAARGEAEKATHAFGQALCLAPSAAPPTARNPMRRLYEAAREAKRCKEPIAVRRVAAERTRGAGGVTVVVRAYVGPDPYHLVSGGDVEVWGSGGAIIEGRKVRADAAEDESVLAGSFPDEGQLETIDGNLLVRVIAKDVSGVSLAAFGVPDPAVITIGASREMRSLRVPWWVWVAGGIAIAGAATTVVALTAGGDPKEGIGPIRGSF